VACDHIDTSSDEGIDDACAIHQALNFLFEMQRV
jgi:hypothetical protein